MLNEDSKNFSKGDCRMETARKIGIGIVMMIPSFVGAGFLWDIFESWFAVIVWILIMTGVTGSIIRRIPSSVH